MAIGGGKGAGKGKKINKKKTVDPFLKKEWYEIKAPSMFKKATCARTLVTRTQGTKIASEGLKKRVVSISLGDLNEDNSEYFRKFQLQIENVVGRNCYTQFHGMSLARDKLCSLVKKKQSTIEIRADVKTADGYKLRIFILAFTTRPREGTMYAKSSAIRVIRKKIIDKVTSEVAPCDLKSVVEKLIPDSIGEDARKAGSSVFPLGTAIVKKVKILKRPKLDVGKLMALHGLGGGQGGENAARDHYEPPTVTSV